MLLYHRDRDGSAQTNCTEVEVADPTFYLTRSQYIDIRPTSLSGNPITPGVWQSCYWSTNFQVTGITRTETIPEQMGIEPGPAALEEDALTTWPTRRLIA